MLDRNYIRHYKIIEKNEWCPLTEDQKYFVINLHCYVFQYWKKFC